ncbi:surfactant, pulmonary-associated protein D [Chondromyces apiculatus DSM 436]|uniref:Surfactant, pulmonary-associated protein D n=1 Tax=Chondromyces apiculatus DSM 436 TaxID=1192034 RepID=A0A017T8S2_9BACT|nr:surfactant, pulmonary-associated protein D [Chondromyces apiculatus DSM 436]
MLGVIRRAWWSGLGAVAWGVALTLGGSFLAGCEEVSGLSGLTFACFPESDAEACAGVACGEVLNQCGEPVTCPDTCPAPYACEAGGVGANTCGCTGGTNLTPPAPEGCVLEDGRMGLGNSFYACDLNVSFQVGRDLCRSFGTDLAILGSSGENTVARQAMSMGSWIGLWDEAETELADDFLWVDGSPVTFSAWTAGEPNNTGGGEHCVEMIKPAGTWNDAPCGNKRAVLCETTCPALTSE